MEDRYSNRHFDKNSQMSFLGSDSIDGHVRTIKNLMIKQRDGVLCNAMSRKILKMIKNVIQMDLLTLITELFQQFIR